MHPTILFGDEPQVEACLSSFGDSGNHIARKGARFVSNVPSARKSCGIHLMELLGEWVMWNLISVRLETVLVLVQYWCTVCTECTIGLEIVMDTPDGTPR
jgi:hypothetical protein